MINKKIIKGIKGIIEKNRIRPSLECVQIYNNILTASNLSTSVKIKGVEAPNGCYTIAQLENNCLENKKFDVDDFPNIEARKDLECIEFEASFFEGIKSVLFAVADPENVACSGVRVESTGEKLIFIATDTFRMIKKEYEKILPKFEITIPEKTCQAIINLFDVSSCLIKIYKDRIELFQNDITIISRIIELAFPNWQGVYSSIFTDNELLFNKTELQETLKELLPIAKNNYNAKNGAVFEVINNSVKITAVSDDMKKEINIDTIAKVNNDCKKFALNIKFILEYLKSIKSDEITIKYSNDKAVFVIDDFILMPLTVNSFEV